MSVSTLQLPGSDEVSVVRDFLAGSEHMCLLGWAEAQFADGRLVPNAMGQHRYYRRYKEDDSSVPAIFWDIRRRAVAMYSIAEYEDEPEYKCFLGCNTEGGFVQRHTDSAPPDKHHVRMNIMLSKPERGGDPVIGGKTISICEGDLWCFYPSLMVHESTPVAGPRKRFVISIGILVPRNLA
ncbi:MAG TPA: hypothetical protein VGK90_14300 [Rhizomicrobium sp.]|jgi:hypothetical protein